MMRDLQAVIRQSHRRFSEALALLEHQPSDHPDYDAALTLMREALGEMVAVYGREVDAGQTQMVADALAHGSLFVGYGVAVVPLGAFNPARESLARHIATRAAALLAGQEEEA